MSEIRRITVVGAGQMGAGIAQTAAVGGFDVTLSDVAPGQLECDIVRFGREPREPHRHLDVN